MCPVIHGTRCLTVEVQALTATGFLGSAKRRVSGLDANRLAMVIVVLEHHGGLRLADQDVFVNAVGGVRISEPAADLARLFEADVSLMHVEVPHGERTILGMKAGEAAIEKMRLVSEHYLQHLAATNSELFEQPGLRAVVATYPAAAVMDAARECEAGLIAMATHGRGGLSRLILGSTANEVLIHSHVPVLLYRPQVHAEGAESTEEEVAETRSG